MKKIGILILALFVSIGIVYVTDSLQAKSLDSVTLSGLQSEQAIIPQTTTLRAAGEHEVFMIYEKDRLLGVVHNQEILDAMLLTTYKERYEADFPNTKLGLGEDIHTMKTLSLLEYEDKDTEIMDYLKTNNAFSVKSASVNFSNGAVLFVKDINDYYAALDEYALNFVDKESYDKIKVNQTIPELANGQYGDRIMTASFMQTATISEGLAPVNKIAKTKEEVVSYLSYGYDADKKEYTTLPYDTVAGVAWLEDIKVEQLLANNSGILKTENQILQEGTVLDVTPLNSPVQFSVSVQHKEAQDVLPGAPEIIEDATLSEGKEEIVQYAENGTKNVIVEETLINGISQGGTVVSSITTKEPIREIRKVGTFVEPRVGSGRFIWPTENPSISCGQGCYSGHQGTDIQNSYDKWGKVLASDRGVVEINSFQAINGYYYVINHNNGYWTYYGHMARPGFFNVGDVVAQGEIIGDIGDTGMATGPHVHFEIRNQGGMLGNSLPFTDFFH